MKDEVKIVVCGDPGVGKSSIIKVLITETFEEEVQPVLPTILVPREVTPEKVHVAITDTPSDPPFEGKLNDDLRRADVIVLVYDVSNDDTRERIRTFWLPKFRDMNISVPIVLVANKIDKRTDGENPDINSLQSHIQPIMDQFKELDVCIECSAKNLMNIAEVFYYAQKAVLHPTFPLYDVDKHELKPMAALALTRIFMLCDKDRDGILNDIELNDFQQECFGVPLKDTELEGVKQVIRDKGPSNGISADGGLTVHGFIFLHTLFVQKGRLETTWIVLRKFGYDDDLRLALSNDDKIVKKADQCCELSEQGRNFLEALFDEADENKDGLISVQQYEKIIKRCPDDPFDFPDKTLRVAEMPPLSNREAQVSKAAYLAHFAVLAFENPEAAMLTLLYMGYEDKPNTGLQVSRSRKRDRYQRSVSRDVFNTIVMGQEGVGKSELIAAFVKSDFGNLKKGADVISCGYIPVEKEFGGGDKFLMMREVPESNVNKFLTSKAAYDVCDVICMVFDVNEKESLEFVKKLYLTLKGMTNFKLPVVFVATKTDLITDDGRAESEAILTLADSFCEKNGMPTPVRVSVKESQLHNLYHDLVGVALNPQLACPDYYTGAAAESSYLATTAKIAAGTVAIGLGIYGAKLLYDYYKRPSSNT